jgi:HK97 family phage prohead protease
VPWKVVSEHPGCPASKPWGVVVIATGEKVGCHATKADAQAQVAALNVNAKGTAMERETRAHLGHELRAYEENGEHFATMRLITPNVADDFGSVWNAHAFDKYAEKRLPVLCWSHDWSDPIGKGIEYTPSDEGPTVKFKFSNFDAVPRARQAFSQIADGTIEDCSVGFSNTKRRDLTEEEQRQHPDGREFIEQSECDETSCVLRGAVPNAKVLSLRSANGKREVPMEFVIKLARDIKEKKITKEEAKVAIDLVADQGTPTGSGDEGGGGDETVTSEDPSPSTAETEADEALDELADRGIILPERRAEWTAAYISNLPDSSFAYIEPGGSKDADGKTTPRSKRHFPIKDANGKCDAPHVSNALSRAPQSPFGDKAMPKIKACAKALGIGEPAK